MTKGLGLYREANLSDPKGDFSEEHLYWMRKFNWVSQLGKQLGVDQVINPSVTGGSNERILRTSLIDILGLLKLYKPEDIFVVIGWTLLEKFEISFQDKSKVGSFPS